MFATHDNIEKCPSSIFGGDYFAYFPTIVGVKPPFIELITQQRLCFTLGSLYFVNLVACATRMVVGDNLNLIILFFGIHAKANDVKICRRCTDHRSSRMLQRYTERAFADVAFILNINNLIRKCRFPQSDKAKKCTSNDETGTAKLWAILIGK